MKPTNVVSITTKWQKNYPECGSSAFIRLGSNYKNCMRTLMNAEKRPDFNVFGFPGGSVNVGESHFDAMKRELREETGYVFNSATWTYKYTILSPNGVTYVYRVPDDYHFCKPTPQPREVERVVFMRDSEITNAIASGDHKMMLTCEIQLRFRRCQFDLLRAVPEFCLIDPILMSRK